MWEAKIRTQKLSEKNRKDIKEIFPEMEDHLLTKPLKVGHLKINHGDLAREFLHWMGHEVRIASFHSIIEAPDAAATLFVTGSWEEYGRLFILQLHDDFIEIGTEDLQLFNQWIVELKRIAKDKGIVDVSTMVA